MSLYDENEYEKQRGPRMQQKEKSSVSGKTKYIL